MPEENNPAGRLYVILDQLRKQDERITLVNAWANVFELEHTDTSDVLVAISEVMKLVQETKKQVMLLDVKHELFMRPFIEIQKVFTLGFSHQLTNAKPFLVDDVMIGLEHCDERLADAIGENLIEEEKLVELQTKVQELIKEFEESNLPPELKRTIIDNLNSISRAISHYRIHGAKGLKDATDRAFGSAVFYAIYDNPRPDKADEKLINKYGKYLFYVMSVVADAYAIAQLSDGVVEKLALLVQ